MKSYLRSGPPASSGDKMRISKREVERMIEVEVKNAMKKKERALDDLIDTIQEQLDQGMSSEASMKMLQARMMLVAERAEKALTHLNERPTPALSSPSSHLLPQTPPLADSTEFQSQLEVKNAFGESIEGSSVSEFMENTKKQFERLNAENAALKAAFEDIQRERATPSPTTVRRSSGQVMEGLAKLLHIKREPTDPPDNMSSTATVSVKRTNEEFIPSEANRNTKRIKLEPGESPHPPLPHLPLPMCPPAEAAQYSLPPRLKIELAHIRNPSPQISVMWKWGECEPKSPPMATVKVFFTTEPVLGCGFFEPWQELEEVKASKIPMAMISQYRAGHKICVAVVCKDIFGRYGPFSKVECAYM